MTRTLAQTWWLLALCGILDAIHAAINVVMIDPDSSITLRGFAGADAVIGMGILALAAGACAIAAGLWCFGTGKSWLLSLHGLALGAFGLIAISPLVKGPLSFRPISLLFVLMAGSIGAFAITAARAASRAATRRVAAAISLAFALSFLAVGFGLVKLEPNAFWIWMSTYFAFCAIFMLWLTVYVRREAITPLPSPGYANQIDQSAWGISTSV